MNSLHGMSRHQSHTTHFTHLLNLLQSTIHRVMHKSNLLTMLLRNSSRKHKHMHIFRSHLISLIPRRCYLSIRRLKSGIHIDSNEFEITDLEQVPLEIWMRYPSNCGRQLNGLIPLKYGRVQYITHPTISTVFSRKTGRKTLRRAIYMLCMVDLIRE